MKTITTIKTYDIRCRVKVNVLDGTFEVSSPVVTESNEAYVEAAKDKHAGDEGNVEVDDDAAVSISEDGGAYVASWTWISAEDAGV